MGRFCTSCGADLASVVTAAPQGTSPGPSDGISGARLGWVVAAFLLVAIILVVVFPVLNRSVQPPAASGPAPGPPALGAAPNVDLSSMTPREAAERLFNRVMTAVAAGDESEARNFAPMAVAAYERAEPLDVSGTFDLSLLRAVNQEYQGALDTAEQGLRQTPDHLFLFSAAGAAASALGDRERAEGHYRRLLEVYDAQVALNLPEYVGRPSLLPQMRAEAEAFLGSGAP